MKKLIILFLFFITACTNRVYETIYIDDALEKIPYRIEFDVFKNFEYKIGTTGVINKDSCKQKLKNHFQSNEKFKECPIKLSNKLKEVILEFDTHPQLKEKVEIIKPVLFSKKKLNNRITLQFITFTSTIKDCTLCNEKRTTYILFEIDDSITAIVRGNQTTFMIHHFIEYLGDTTFMVKQYASDEASLEYELSEIVVFKVNEYGKIEILNIDEAQRVIGEKYELIDYWDYVDQNRPIE